MALVLHAHPLSSYCWKVLIALYESGTPFEFRLLDLGNETGVAAFRALWPIGRMPVLVDGDRAIVESSIIIEYLDARQPEPNRLLPADPESALEVRKLDRIFDNYVMTSMQKIVFDRLRPADSRDPAGVEDARRLIDTAYRWLEDELVGRRWAGGDDFTLADCAAGPSLYYADKVRPMRERSPGLYAYLERLKARPSFTRVLSEAEPYAHMFPQEG